MKAILVIDIDDCEDITNYGGNIYYYPAKKFVHLDVPSRPLPEKKELTNDLEQYVFAEGWNACLDKITGEEE